MSLRNLVVEPGEEKAPSICQCCGKPRYDAFGFVSSDDEPFAVYFATWSPGHPNQGVWLAVTLGDWSESAGAEDRRMATLILRSVDDRVEFSLTDTDSSPWAESAFAKMKLTRAETLQDPELNRIFHVAENVVGHDDRMSSFLGAH